MKCNYSKIIRDNLLTWKLNNFNKENSLNNNTCIDEVVGMLSPDVFLIDLPTNDSMKYQQGKFVLFSNCISTKRKFFCKFNKSFLFKKYNISRKLKLSIFDFIKNKKNEHYKLSKLLVPCKRLNE